MAILFDSLATLLSKNWFCTLNLQVATRNRVLVLKFLLREQKSGRQTLCNKVYSVPGYLTMMAHDLKLSLRTRGYLGRIMNGPLEQGREGREFTGSS